MELIKDRERLHAYLSRDRVRAAYHIGVLDPSYYDFCRWYGLVDSTCDIHCLLLHYTGLSAPALFTLGESEGMELLFREASRYLPRRFYAHVLEEHEDALRTMYVRHDMKRIVRMALERDRFTPHPDAGDVELVTHADTAELMALYRFYPDNFFEPHQLESGYYFGIRRDGRLVSVSGVHVVSEQYDIAAIGNIVTDPEYRNQGLSSRCTSYLLGALFDRVSLVALNVAQDNDVAYRCYERFGFEDHCIYLEGFTERF